MPLQNMEIQRYIWKAESRSGMENVAMTFVNGILKSKMKG